MSAAGARVLYFTLGAGLAMAAIGLAWKFYPGPWQSSGPTPLELAFQRREALQASAAPPQLVSRPATAPAGTLPAPAFMLPATQDPDRAREAGGDAADASAMQAALVPKTAAASPEAAGEPQSVRTLTAPEAGWAQALSPDALLSDPELAELERNRERLRVQAESVSGDLAGMRRRAAQARARRDACGDRDCLLRWYAARRRQLLAEF